jgi:hypothetical protein
VNTPIRLLAALLLLTSVSVLSAGCAGGTRAGASAPRLVREPMILRNDGAAHVGASAVLQQGRPSENVPAASPDDERRSMAQRRMLPQATGKPCNAAGTLCHPDGMLSHPGGRPSHPARMLLHPAGKALPPG